MGELAAFRERSRRQSLPAEFSDREASFCSDDFSSCSTKREVEWSGA
jgi:hypothetical protein